MYKLIRYFFIFALFVSGCKKPDYNSYLNDPIYKDLQSKLQSTEKEIIDEEKNLEDKRKEFESANPQSTFLKKLESRYFEAEKRIYRLNQEKKFLIISLQSRKKSALDEYLADFKENKPHNADKGYAEYQLQEKLRFWPQNWSGKERVEKYQKQNKAGSAQTATNSSPKGH